MHYFYTNPTSIFLHKVSLLVVLSAFVGAPTSGRLFFVFTSYACRMVASGYDDFCSYGERNEGAANG